jgi:hypothetical protein
MAWTQRLRHLTQFAFGALIIITSLTLTWPLKMAPPLLSMPCVPSAVSKPFGAIFRRAGSLSPRLTNRI